MVIERGDKRTANRMATKRIWRKGMQIISFVPIDQQTGVKTN